MRFLQDGRRRVKPGASVAVVQQGKPIFAKGYGSAHLEYDVPVRAETVFHVASVSKQFTAMALVLLEQQKKLSLEDDIRKYLTELRDYGRKVTIRQLLQHTGGIRDQWQTLSMAGWRMDDVITQQRIPRMMARRKELNFAPGAEHLYSNGGYTLAAEIAARVSGVSFEEFCAAAIFRPLGMERTHSRGSPAYRAGPGVFLCAERAGIRGVALELCQCRGDEFVHHSAGSGEVAG